MPRRRLMWIAAALAASALISSACIGGAPETSPAATAKSPGATGAVIATAAPPPAESNELITGAGWECNPAARVADGKLVVKSSGAFVSVLNDHRLRLQIREDVAISITLEADAAPGFGGLQFWNSLPPPGDSARWFSTAAKLQLGLAGGRVQAQAYDGTNAAPAFTYNGPAQTGPVALAVQREGDVLVFRIAGAEVMRTKVLGPLTGGPLFFGAAVAASKTLTVHRFVVTDGAHPRGAEIVRALAPPAPAGPAPSLRSGAAARSRLFGAAAPLRSLRWDQQFRDVAAREFNLLNAADTFQWNVLRPARDQYQFCAEDQFVAFAQANNMRTLGGMLTWTHNPPWLTQGTFSRDELIAILREHIQTVVGRYRGRVYAWNVVNEPVDPQNGGLLKGEEQLWTRLIGPEYIDMAFRWAHEADPQAVLLLNEYNAEGFNRKSDGLYELVKGMLARGVPINGVGMQTHWGDGRQTFPIQRFDRSTVGPNMKRLADLGLDVYITEMDVTIAKPVTPDKLAAQAQTYRQMLEVCLAASNCKAFIVFGIHDGDAPSVQEAGMSAYAAPLLFDESFRPKPAYEALAEVLQGR